MHVGWAHVYWWAHAWGGMLAGAAAYLGCQGIWRYLRSCTRTVVILEQLQLYSGKAKKNKKNIIFFATGTLLAILTML